MGFLPNKVSETQLVLLLLCGTGMAFLLCFVLPVLLARAHPAAETPTTPPTQIVHGLPGPIRTLRLMPIGSIYPDEWLRDSQTGSQPSDAIWVDSDTVRGDFDLGK